MLAPRDATLEIASRRARDLRCLTRCGEAAMCWGMLHSVTWIPFLPAVTGDASFLRAAFEAAELSRRGDDLARRHAEALIEPEREALAYLQDRHVADCFELIGLVREGLPLAAELEARRIADAGALALVARPVAVAA